MQQIVNFLIRNKNFLLFLTLFCLSLFFTIQSHSYHKSKFINSANVISGGTYNVMNNINQYFNLKDENHEQDLNRRCSSKRKRHPRHRKMRQSSDC